MARESKAQKLEKKRQQEFEDWNQFWLSYADRLVLLVYGYSTDFGTEGYAVRKWSSDEGTWLEFHSPTEGGSDNIWCLPINLQAETDRILAGEPMNMGLILTMEGAENALWRAHQRREEQQRQKTVRAQALAKLSEEERSLLGLQ